MSTKVVEPVRDAGEVLEERPVEVPVLRLATIPVGEIRLLPDRARQHPQEGIEDLAESIRTVGLLQRPGVAPNEAGGYDLVYGARRFLACRDVLGWQELDVLVGDHLTDPYLYAVAQADENNIRRDFTTWERLLSGRQILDAEREAARLRQRSGRPVSDLDKGRALERAGRKVGYSHSTLAHGLELVDKSLSDPDNYGDLGLALQQIGAHIDPLWYEAKRRELAPPPPEEQPEAETRHEPAPHHNLPQAVSRWLTGTLPTLASGEVIYSSDKWDFDLNGHSYRIVVEIEMLGEEDD